MPRNFSQAIQARRSLMKSHEQINLKTD